MFLNVFFIIFINVYDSAGMHDTVWQMVPMNYSVHKERMLVLLFLVVR
jgi:hypothetical protein